ncbi:hypothetical protein K402DRAFT_239331 [Aulographum hederae CBS 113979]|uniref:Uncharacterized protein n=1 Tax=Aulographum hederae CBS 113979 TaxID=1176131 RepID=A0A6G1GK47_9PEZI|nr:hypothetical protein K402DRAFT_239331 [Aulographum hederae CBS 113979]
MSRPPRDVLRQGCAALLCRFQVLGSSMIAVFCCWRRLRGKETLRHPSALVVECPCGVNPPELLISKAWHLSQPRLYGEGNEISRTANSTDAHRSVE